MTIVRFPNGRISDRLIGMHPDNFTLAGLVSLAALVGATIEYFEIVKRRSQQRLAAAEREEGAAIGRHGLARVLLVDKPQ
jgi:hypothetical protein